MLQNAVLLMVFDVLQSRKTHSTFSGKPNAFLIILGAISAKGGKLFKFIRFYKGFRNAFLHFENVKFDRFYKVFRRSGNALRKPSLGNAFLIILRAISEKGAPKSSFSTGFIRV